MKYKIKPEDKIRVEKALEFKGFKAKWETFGIDYYLVVSDINEDEVYDILSDIQAFY